MRDNKVITSSLAQIGNNLLFRVGGRIYCFGLKGVFYGSPLKVIFSDESGQNFNLFIHTI